MPLQKNGSSAFALNHNIFIWGLGVLLLIVSIATHAYEQFALYRLLRGMVSLSFLGLALILKGKRINLFVILFLFIYGISSLLTIWYEDMRFAVTSLGLNVVAFAILVLGLIPKVSVRNIGIWLAFVFIALLVINAYLLYEFITMLKNFAQGNLHYAFMLLGAMSMVVAGLFAMLFNHVNSSKASLLFTVAIFSIIFAEIFRAIAYYNVGYGDTSVYIARFLLILGTIFLIFYSLMSKSLKEELGKTPIS